jgi:hypothetical protein
VKQQSERRGFRVGIKHIVLWKAEAGQVLEFRERLMQALAEFGVGFICPLWIFWF